MPGPSEAALRRAESELTNNPALWRFLLNDHELARQLSEAHQSTHEIQATTNALSRSSMLTDEFALIQIQHLSIAQTRVDFLTCLRTKNIRKYPPDMQEIVCKMVAFDQWMRVKLPNYDQVREHLLPIFNLLHTQEGKIQAGKIRGVVESIVTESKPPSSIARLILTSPLCIHKPVNQP